MEENRDNAKPIIIGPSDHLANERTFLAWIRTGIALMGFGFVVVKFALFIRQISLALHKPGMAEPSKGYSSEIGTGLVAAGVIMACYAYTRYRITEKQLSLHQYRPSYLLAILVTVLILVSGIALIFSYCLICKTEYFYGIILYKESIFTAVHFVHFQNISLH